jgi:hypothetical protein
LLKPARVTSARECEARALSHQRIADRKAEEAPDPESAAAHRAEAMIHARAAKIHREAVELQAEHAQQHEP